MGREGDLAKGTKEICKVKKIEYKVEPEVSNHNIQQTRETERQNLAVCGALMGGFVFIFRPPYPGRCVKKTSMQTCDCC